MEAEHQQSHLKAEAESIISAEGSGTAPLADIATPESAADQQPDAALTAAAAEAVSVRAHDPDSQQQQQHSSTLLQVPKTPQVAAEVAVDPTASLLQIISFSAAKHNNLHLLDDDTLLMGVGCMVLLLHLPSMKQRWLPGRDGGGVAAVAVHPSRQHFLVAERCKNRPPNM
jgi:hypothetical protein